MAVSVSWTCALFLCILWLSDRDASTAMAFPAGSSKGANKSGNLPQVNTTVNDLAYVIPASEGIWQITETGGNESALRGEDLDLRSGWTTEKKKEQLETMEGWLNSGIITKNMFVPYTSNAILAPVGNGSEDWKKSLLKSGKIDHSHYRKILFDEKRPRPFQYFRQIQLSKNYWRLLNNT